MNICKNYLIKCPWALVTWDELPCFVDTQENCNMWREKYKKEAPEEYKKAIEMKEKLKNLDEATRMKELERLLSLCYK